MSENIDIRAQASILHKSLKQLDDGIWTGQLGLYSIILYYDDDEEAFDAEMRSTRTTVTLWTSHAETAIDCLEKLLRQSADELSKIHASHKHGDT